MKTLYIILTLLVSDQIFATDSVPVRDPVKEGGASWQWDVFYRPVLVIVGSLGEISKPRPDFSIQASYATWSKLTGPPGANEPTEKGFYLLLTKAKVKQFIFVDHTLLHTDANINWVSENETKELNCILPAKLRQVAQPNEDGVSVYDYALSDMVASDLKPNTDYVLIFQHVGLYPLEGLYLSSVADLKDLEEIKAICTNRSREKK